MAPCQASIRQVSAGRSHILEPQFVRNILDIWYKTFDSSPNYVGRTRTGSQSILQALRPGPPPLDQAITRCRYFCYTGLHKMVLRLQTGTITVIPVSISADAVIRSRNPSSLVVSLCIRSASKGSVLYARFGLSAPATHSLELLLTFARPVLDRDSIGFSHW
jgi:hypothetical protein